MLAGLLTTAVLAASASASSFVGIPGVTRNNVSKRMILDETGCVCQGIYMGAGTSAFSYGLLYSGYPEGWCWQDGTMTAASVGRIQDGIDAEGDTNYVNGTWVIESCRVQNVPMARCATYIAQLTTMLWDSNSLVECEYPPDNFEPVTCPCGWQCNEGYVACGLNCINPMTQTCTSGIPARRRSLLPRRACPVGKTLCPVPARNAGGRDAFECIDTSSNLEACGGCPGDGTAVDCSAIPNIGSASCEDGYCNVTSCLRGYKLVRNKCVRK